MSAALRVLVVDDHPLFRFGLCAALAQREDIEVVGEAAGGQAAIAAAASTAPDVIVMDLHLPDLGGVEATRAITNTTPDVGVLVLTMFDDSESVFNAMRASPPALVAFVAAFLLVMAGGSALTFVVKAGTVAVLANAEAAAGAIERPPRASVRCWS